MEKLLAGMVRFQNEVFPRNRHLYQQLAREQQPEALFICCSDSRVVPHELTQTLPGELFICRNAGNIVPAHGDVLGGVSATVEYAVQVLKVKHIIVCGHSDCGAMRAVLHPDKVQSYRAVARWIRHAERVSAIAHELHHVPDAPEIEQIVDHLELGPGALLDAGCDGRDLRVLRPLHREDAIPSKDGVERRAQLMRHH